MINGTYRFYQNGELIATAKNLWTTEGKRLALRYLAGQAPNLGEALAFGVGDTAASASDTKLTFEVARANVILKNVDYTNNLIVFKTTIPQEDVYEIHEAGLWSQNTSGSNYISKILTTFDTTLESWSNVTIDSTVKRTSADSVKVSAGANATVSTRVTAALDLSGYSSNDSFSLAFNKNDSNITTLKMVFADSAGNTFTNSQSISALPTGYNVLTFNKGGFTATGAIDWSNIANWGFDVTAGATAGTVTLDAVRIEDLDTINANYALVSHAVVSPALVKTSVAPMDIEYALEFTVA